MALFRRVLSLFLILCLLSVASGCASYGDDDGEVDALDIAMGSLVIIAGVIVVVGYTALALSGASLDASGFDEDIWDSGGRWHRDDDHHPSRHSSDHPHR